MTKISIMTMVFGGLLEREELSDVEMLRALELMGYDGVELTAGRIHDVPGGLAMYKEYLADSRMEVACLDVGCNLVGEDAAARQTGIDALRKGIELAAELACPVALAAGSRLSGSISPEDGRRMTADGLNACVPETQAAGVKLAIEDFGVAPRLQCAAADCAVVLNAVEGLSFVFDTGNFYFVGENPLDNMALLANRTCHVHLKDWVKSEEPEIADVAGAALGTGLIPNEPLVEQFVQLAAGESEFLGTFSVELGAPGGKLAGAKTDLDTVRSWLG